MPQRQRTRSQGRGAWRDYDGFSTSAADAARHYLTREEINALCFATHRMKRPKGWDEPFPVGRFWQCALVVFFNYGVDTGTVWKCAPFHEPILWRHVSWERESPDREIKEQSRWGWLFYRRVKRGRPSAGR